MGGRGLTFEWSRTNRLAARRRSRTRGAVGVGCRSRATAVPRHERPLRSGALCVARRSLECGTHGAGSTCLRDRHSQRGHRRLSGAQYTGNPLEGHFDQRSILPLRSLETDGGYRSAIAKEACEAVESTLLRSGYLPDPNYPRNAICTTGRHSFNGNGTSGSSFIRTCFQEWRSSAR